jgi:NADH-quinone oxidoreductase subunit M
MFSHGVMTALFFACVGMIYDQTHTRDLPSLGGFATKTPWVAVAFIAGGLVSMGMPGFSGFVAEFPILIGVWQGVPIGVRDAAMATNGSTSLLNNAVGGLGSYYTYIVVLAVLGIILTAAYVLRVVGQVFFGEFNEKLYPHIKDIGVLDRIALLTLGFWLIFIGLFPGFLTRITESGMKPVADLLASSF